MTFIHGCTSKCFSWVRVLMSWSQHLDKLAGSNTAKTSLLTTFQITTSAISLSQFWTTSLVNWVIASTLALPIMLLSLCVCYHLRSSILLHHCGHKILQIFYSYMRMTCHLSNLLMLSWTYGRINGLVNHSWLSHWTPQQRSWHTQTMTTSQTSIYTLVFIVATLPVTSCGYERSISMLKLVKTSFRSTISGGSRILKRGGFQYVI